MLRWKNTGLSKLKDLSGKKLLRHSGAYTTLLVAVLAMSFFGVCDPNGGMRAPSGAAAKVGSDSITGNEFRRAYQASYQRLQAQFKDGFDPATFRLAHGVLGQLIDERILFAEAVKAGMLVSDDEIARLLADAQAFKDDKGAFSPEAFKNYLRANRYTEASFEGEIRRSLTVQRFKDFVGQSHFVSDAGLVQQFALSESKMEIDYLKFSPADIKVNVTDADVTKFASSDEGKKKIKEYFDGHSSEFQSGAQVRARHILIGFEGSRNASADASKRSKEVARKRAADVLAKVRAAGADFAKVAREFTDEAAGKSKGGDLGFFSREMMVKEFADAAFAMKPGQISEPVESPFGFHVIKVDEIKSARNDSLAQATAGIARKLLAEEGRPALVKGQVDKLASAVAKGGDELERVRKELGLSWQSTGEFAITAKVIPEIGSDNSTLAAISSLKQPGQTAQQLVESRGAHFVLRLKKKVDADMAKLTVDKKNELRRSESGSFGSAYLSSTEKNLREDLKKRGRIWENPDYIKIDERKEVADSGDAAPVDVGG
jgi:peptidyl-prolyl cis-trans isomerase D